MLELVQSMEDPLKPTLLKGLCLNKQEPIMIQIGLRGSLFLGVFAVDVLGGSHMNARMEGFSDNVAL